MKQRSLVLVDADVRRRASVGHSLSAMNIHVKPFESIHESAFKWDGEDAILVHDEPGALTDVINWMRQNDVWFPAIVYAVAPMPAQVVRAMHEGASDYLAWTFTYPELRHALIRAEERLFQLISRNRTEFHARGLVAKLSPRETQVLECMVSGLSNKQIGRTLQISPRTVEIHRANLFRKLGVQHSSQAIRIAIEAGLVGLPAAQ